MVLTGNRPFRALIVGTGSIGRRHIATLQFLCPGLKLAFLRKGARDDALARDCGASISANVAQALQWQPDLAVIATPSDLHEPFLSAVLDAGIACFVEKPVVIRAAEAEALAARDPARLPPTQVGCVLRFVEAVGVLQGWLRQGRLGRLARAQFECGQYLPDWRPQTDYRLSYSAQARRGGGVIFDLVHEVDLAVMLLGAARLAGVMAAQRSSLEIACEDVALLHLEGQAGLPIGVALDYVSRVPVRNVVIVGEAATARLDFMARRLTLISSGGQTETIEHGFDVDAAYRLQFVELLAAIEMGTPTRLPLHEGLRATALAIQAHDAIHKVGQECAA